MLDSNLTRLYRYKNGTKVINHASNRTFSINRLENDFVINSLLNKINI